MTRIGVADGLGRLVEALDVDIETLRSLSSGAVTERVEPVAAAGAAPDRDRARRLWQASWQDELDSAHVYRALAAGASDDATRQLFTQLAGAEEHHAAVCAERLQALGRPVPGDRGPTTRARVLARLGRRLGPRFVLSALEGGEDAAQARYRLLGDAAASIAADEAGHARQLTALVAPEASTHRERHRLGAGNTLRAAVLGANDGLLSNFSLIMGVAGADLSRSSILITGLAGLLAGAGSMALGEWISVQSSREYYQHELEIERRELETSVDDERRELELIYRAKGLTQEEAALLAERVIADPARALETMAREELGIDPDELGGSPWTAAGSSFVLFCLGAIVPVIPYLVASGWLAVGLSALASAAALFGIGAAITLITGRSVLLSGGRQVAVGIAAAAVTYGIGALLGTAVG